MSDVSVLRVRAYLGTVYAAGATCLALVLVGAQWSVPVEIRGILLVTAALLVVSEFLPIRLWRHGSYEEFTFSGAFALVSLQIGPVVYAVLPQIVAVLIVEIRQRKPPRVAAFNVAQNVVIFVLARWVISAVEGIGFHTYTDAPPIQQLTGLALAALVYFSVNTILTGTIVALASGALVGSSVRTAMRENFPVSPIVLGLAPMIAASLEFSAWTAPLCLLLVIAIRMAVKIATQHEVAALHDALTGLPNRSLMLTRLEQSLHGASADRQLGLLMIDLDYFKEINDTLGHGVGDDLLKLVSTRLTDAVGSGGTVARLGGDEFAVVLDRADAQAATALARRLVDALGKPLRLADVTLNVTCSVGVAVAPQHGDDAETLIRSADVALYAAKQERGRHAVYDPRSEEHTTESSVLMGELHHGIERGEIVVYFQPKVNVVTDRIIGVEALVRWQHPTRGLLVPGRFLPAAENTPLIVPLTAQVIHDALAAVRNWRLLGLDITVAVNLTARQVANQELPGQIERALAAHGLPGSALVVEITESSLIANPARTHAVFSRLRSMGVGLSIDDFGTGYSSFTNLRDLPVTEIKIDKSFVGGAAGSTTNAAIVKSVIELGRNLGLNIVAEGVETDHCLDVLTDMGCDVVQGYLLARPMPAEHLLMWSATRMANTVGQIAVAC